MTLETQTKSVTVNGNDVATSFSFSDLIINVDTELVLTHTTTAGAETPLALTTDYAVVVADFPGTGSFTFPEGGSSYSTLATGESIIAKRVLVLEQTADLENQGGYFPDVQETQFDKFIMIDLQQQEDIERSFKRQISDTSGADLTMPDPVAGSIIGIWNTNADAIEIGPTASAISGAEGNATAAAASAAAALVSENAAAADLALTNADVVSTNADVVSTGDDVTATNADVVSTGDDVTATNADVVTTTQDAIDTAADAVSTNADTVAMTGATSTTSLTIAVASKAFTVAAGLGFITGDWVLVTSDADPTNFMHGPISSYASTTLIVNVDNIGGSGTLADWTIRRSGVVGPDGAGDLISTNNLSDVDNASTSFGNIKQDATLTVTGVVEQSTSAENVTGTDDTVFPSVAGTKEMIDTHGASLTRIANQTTTSGTEKTFTIGSGATFFQLNFWSHSMTGSFTTARIGDSGGREDTGYLGSKGTLSASANTASLETVGCTTKFSGAAGIMNGTLTGSLGDPANNTWALTLSLGASNATQVTTTFVSKSLTTELETVHIMAIDGTSTHDLGSIGGFYI